MDNTYVKQYPDLLHGKTVVYVHGFGSSGQSGTVSRLRTVFPNARVIAPDLPIVPAEALSLLLSLCEKEQPDLIIGTSMGGMYAEMLYGYDRILINPAFRIAETMHSHGLTGAQKFYSERQDGVQDFIVTKSLVKEYAAVSGQCFAKVDDAERRRVYALFGDEDNLVDTRDLFLEHYSQAVGFHGGHRMSDVSFMHSVLPVIRWIDDRQRGLERPIVYVGVETLFDSWHKPLSSCRKTIRELIESYRVYFVSSPLLRPGLADVDSWLCEHINVPAWGHTITTSTRELLYGDYFIERPELLIEGSLNRTGTLLDVATPQFKTWDDLADYFRLLGGL